MRQYLPLFGNRNFVLHWLAGAISNLGDFFNSLALVKILSHDPQNMGFYLGLIMLCKVLPTAVLGPVAGAVADRLPRRTIMIISDLVRAALVLGLVFVEQPLFIIGLVFASAVAAVFYNPASSAMLPSLVKPDQLVTAGSLAIMTQRLAMLLGNGIGAAVLIAVGPHNVFYIDSATFVISALLLGFLTVPALAPRRQQGQNVSVFAKFAADMKETIAFLKATPPVRHLMTGLGIAALGDSALGVLLVTFFTVGLGLAAEKMGFLWAMFGATSVIGALVIGVVGRKIHWSHLFTFGAIYVWFMTVGTLLANAIIPSGAFIVLLGLGSGATNVALQAAIGELVPDQVRGRVFGTWGMINSLLYVVGVLSSGALSDRFGPWPVLLAYSFAFLFTGLYSFFAFRGRAAKVQPATAAVGD